jgi:hypothetical protein
MRYDLRFALGVEVPQPVPSTLPPDFATRREKSRTKYTHASYPWTIDMTRVINQGSVRDSSRTANLEVEFEFNERVVELAQNKNVKELRALVALFWKFYNEMMESIQQTQISHSFDELQMQPVGGAAERRRYSRQQNALTALLLLFQNSFLVMN